MKWCIPGLVMLIFAAGVQLHAQQQADTNSVESIKLKAENGDAHAQTVLGAIFEFGLSGATKDVAEAVKWFRKAAEQHFAPAQYALGTCFANGQGVEKDDAEAAKWYLRAAGQNLAVAQYNLGVCYRDGQGVAKDQEEAAICFRKAADQNLAIAQYNLGVCYDSGQGVGKDYSKALNWYRKAADQNLAYAQCNLGAHYENGLGVAQDHTEAVRLYRKAADQNYALAQYNLAVCYANGSGVVRDGAEAVKWYRLAADQNNALAQCNLGTYFANGQGVPKDAEEAVRWFRKAAMQNDSEAQYNLGFSYYNGQGVAQNNLEAYIWFSLSAAQGDTDASKSRNSIASRLSQADIAEAQSRIASFVPRKTSTDRDGQDYTTPATFLNQLAYMPLTHQEGATQQTPNPIPPNPDQPNPSTVGTAAAQNAPAQDYFTVGSTKAEVLAIQGEPTAFTDWYLSYGMSMVMLHGGKVVNWNNADVKLKARYLTATNLIPKEYFTLGSTKEDVLAIHGEPTTFSDNYLAYGMSMVMFRDGKVVNWNNADVKLKARYLTATNLIPKEYFTVGSTREEVLAIHGEPTSFSDNYLAYGMSMVMFQDGKVVNWNNVDVPLKARKPSGADLTSGLPRQQLSPEPVAPREPQTSKQLRTPTPAELEYLKSQGVDTSQNVQVDENFQMPSSGGSQSGDTSALGAAVDTAKAHLGGWAPNPPPPSYSPPQGSAPPNPPVQQPEQPQIHGIAYMDTFMGEKNFCIPSDNVISMKTEALKFQINGQTYDYSGHYAVMLITPRKHKNPSFGFGTAEKAKLIIIDDFGGESLPLADATIWEKSNGFIDAEALGKEWIYSGTYTIQK